MILPSQTPTGPFDLFWPPGDVHTGPLPDYVDAFRFAYDAMPDNQRVIVLKSRKVGAGAEIASTLRRLYLDRVLGPDATAAENGMGC